MKTKIKIVNVLGIIFFLYSPSRVAAEPILDDFNYSFEAQFERDDFFPTIDDESVSEVVWQVDQLSVSWADRNRRRIDQVSDDETYLCDSWYFASYELANRSTSHRYYSGNLLRAEGDSVLSAAVTSLNHAYQRALRLKKIIQSEAQLGSIIRINFGLAHCLSSGDDWREEGNLLDLRTAQDIGRFQFFRKPGISQLANPLSKEILRALGRARKP